EIEATDAAERAKVQAGMQDVEARIERDMEPYVAANQMDTDELIALEEIRDWLGTLIEMSYQATGYRRVKNSRIWSLHDLQRIGQQAALAHAAQATLQASATTSPSSEPKANAQAHGKAGLQFCAPMSGRFYWRASPDAEPFVQIGATLRHGDPIGLIE